MSPTKKTTAKKTGSGFSAAERAAMKERAEEMRAEGRGGKKKADDAAALLAKLEEMSQPDRGMAERIHTILSEVAPGLDPKTWYGMPAWARDGKVVCYFQPAEKFGARYATFGFNDPARLDDGTMWPTAFALTDLTDADAKRITELIRRAAG